MAAPIEHEVRPYIRKENSLAALLARIPEAIIIATIETESLREANTPEGKFVLTYLFAARNVLQPALNDLRSISSDLMRPIGGPEYNPERSIDEVGTAVAFTLAEHTRDIPHFWIRIEESGKWERAGNGAPITEGERFAVIDPLDMTSSIPKDSRTQTTGIAIYDKAGTLLTAGIMSLVDDGFVFIEKQGDTYTVVPKNSHAKHNNQPNNESLRASTLTRRMHALRDTPLFTDPNTDWKLKCTSGYAVLSLIQGNIDTIVDPFKGNPWYENVIWYAIAQTLGYSVTDKEGKPLNFAKTMQTVTRQEITNGHRMPAIVSRTPEIHNRVLELLKKPNES